MNGILGDIVDFIQEPSVLVGIIVLVGLLLQKKAFEDVVKATLKAMVGFVVISASADVISASLAPFGEMFQYGFNINGVIPNNEAVVALAIKDYGQATALIMAFGMIANILIARFTKFKNIFLTGHVTLYMACMVAVILSVSGMTGVQLVFTGALALGIIMVLSPAMCQPFMKDVTKNDSVALGHFSSVGYACAGLIGRAVGKNSKSTEEMNVPKSLSFLRDSVVSISITMLILYIVVAIAAGAEYVETNLSGGQNFIVFSMMQALKFAAGFIQRNSYKTCSKFKTSTRLSYSFPLCSKCSTCWIHKFIYRWYSINVRTRCYGTYNSNTRCCSSLLLWCNSRGIW